MRVAIVDDNSGIRRLLAEVLTSETGVEIVGDAADGDEVPAMVEATRPDFVIMDYAMPRMDGVAATAALHATHPSVEVVAFTSTTDPVVVGGFLAGGATHHFDKSQIDELTAYVAARATEVRGGA
jgi:DNA-binding NarL/FixJ family response regulator